MGNNASPTKKGFNYQDVIALEYLLKEIDRLKSINIEGIEDVDLHYTDGTTTYVQTKMAVDVNSKRRSDKLNESLRVLIQDYLGDKYHSKAFIYATNSHYPLRVQKDFDFSNEYVAYNYNSLNDVLHRSIMSQIRKVKNEKDKDNKLKYPRINAMPEEEIKKFLDKFTIVKCWYEGADDESKLKYLDKRIEEFIVKADIRSRYTSRLKEGWYYMVVRSSEDEKKKITKEDFVAHTFVAVSFGQVDYHDFFDKCGIDYPSQNYINSQSKEIENAFLTHFEFRPAIIKMYSKYVKQNSTKRGPNVLVDFINDEADQLDNIVKFSVKSQIRRDVAKYIAWIVVTQNSEFENIKKVANYED